jgi:hypothetical protein
MAKKKDNEGKKKKSPSQAIFDTHKKAWIRSEGVTKMNSVSGIYGKSSKKSKND